MCQGPGGNRESFNVHRVSFLQAENLLETLVLKNVSLTLLNCTLKNSYDGGFYITCLFIQFKKLYKKNLM